MRTITSMLSIAALLMLALTFGCEGETSGGDQSGGSSSSGGSSGGGSGGAPANPTEAQLAQDVLTLVNQERSAQGLPALSWNNECAQVAYDHSVDMDLRDFFSHTNPDGLDPFDRMAAAGITYTAAGENIAAGYPTAQDVMTGWMNSPGHRANILSPNFTELGVGVRQGTTGQYGTYWTQVFLRP